MPGSAIKVVVRLRPFNSREKQSNTLPVVTASSQRSEVTVVKGFSEKAVRHSYRFDNVFGAFTTQEEVFQQTLSPIVSDVLKGFESTVFAYGQTGTGKTFTMEGNVNVKDQEGVIPRSCQAIFSALCSGRFKEHSVRVSYLEIYNEELTDLLTGSGGLKVSACSDGSTTCVGLSEVDVDSPEEVINIIRESQERRQTAETNMNKASSRSHCLFTLVVTSKEEVDGGVVERQGKLHLVDLAGSECAKSTGAASGSVRFRESQNINKSLLTLGRVITALRDKQSRVPYRDSKLTRLLQEALGGKSKTCIIATVSPSSLCVEETLSTLKYAEKAQGITNKAVSAAVRMTANATGTASSSAGGVFDGNDKASRRTFAEMEARYIYMTSQCEEAQAALGRKHDELMTMAEKAKTTEAALAGAQTALDTSVQSLKQATAANEAMFSKLEEQQLALARKNKVVQARRETEGNLHTEAKALINTLEGSISNGESLHATIVEEMRLKQVLRDNAKEFFQTSKQLLQDMKSKVPEFASVQKTKRSELHSLVTEGTTEANSKLAEWTESSRKEHEREVEAVSELGEAFRGHLQKANTELSAHTESRVSDLNELAKDLDTQCQQGTANTNALCKVAAKGEEDIANWCEATKQRLDNFEKKITESLGAYAQLMDRHMEGNQNKAQQQKDMLRSSKNQLGSLSDALANQLSAQSTHTNTITQLQKNLSTMMTEQVQLVQEQHVSLTEAATEQSQVHAALCSKHSESLCLMLNELTSKGESQAALFAQQQQALEQTLSEHQANAMPVSSEMAEALAKLSSTMTSATSQQQAALASQHNRLTTTNESVEQLGGNDRRFEQHMETLEQAAAHLRASTTEQQSLLSEQKNKLVSTLDLHVKSGEGVTEAEHLRFIGDLATHVQKSTNSHVGVLKSQAEALTDARAKHLEGQQHSEEVHKETIERVRMHVETTSESQQQALREQNASLKSLLESQKMDQKRILETVMTNVQQLLSNELNKLDAELTGGVQSLTTNNDSLIQNVGEFKTKLCSESAQMVKETNQWCDKGTTTAASLHDIKEVNNEVQAALGTMAQQAASQIVELTGHTEAWATCAKQVSENVRGITEQNEQGSTMINSMMEKAEEFMQTTTEQTNQWSESVKSAKGSISTALTENGSVNQAISTNMADVETQKDEMAGKVAGWGACNVVVENNLKTAIEANTDMTGHQVANQQAISDRIAHVSDEANEILESGNKIGKDINKSLESNGNFTTTLEEASKSLDSEVAKVGEEAVGITANTQAVDGMTKALTKDNEAQIAHTQAQQESFKQQGSETTEQHSALTTTFSDMLGTEHTEVASHLASRKTTKDAVAEEAEKLCSGFEATTTMVGSKVGATNKELVNESERVTQDWANFEEAQQSMREKMIGASKDFSVSLAESYNSQTTSLSALTAKHSESLDEQGDVCDQFAGETVDHVTRTEGVIGDYCTTKAQMDEVVAEVSPLEQFEFSHDISETAPESEIESQVELTADVMANLRKTLGLSDQSTETDATDTAADTAIEAANDITVLSLKRAVLSPVKVNTMASADSKNTKGSRKQKLAKPSAKNSSNVAAHGVENVAPKDTTVSKLKKRSKRLREPSKNAGALKSPRKVAKC